MVVCAVKLCRNYTGKNIRAPEGISFHRFPTDPELRQVWVAAIQRDPQWVPGTHCRICSVHFDNADFKVTDSGRRILLKEAIPSKNLYREEREDVDTTTLRRVRRTRLPLPAAILPTSPSAGPLACRVCLITDVPLCPIEGDTELSFVEVFGSEPSPPVTLPQWLCAICRSTLIQCARFRVRAHTAQALLAEADGRGEQITTDYIRSIDRHFHNLALNLSIKKLPILDLTEIQIKQEEVDNNMQILMDDDNITNDNDNDVQSDDYDIFNDKTKAYESDVKTENDNFAAALFDDKSFLMGSQDLNNKNEVFVEEIEADQLLGKEEKRIIKKRKSELRRNKKIKKLKREELKGIKEKINVKDLKQKKHQKEDIRNTKARKTDEDYELFASEHEVDIVFLSLQEQIAEVQARKESDNYKNSRFKCDECFRGFTGESAFKNHKAKHDPAMGKYVCEPCGFRFQKRYRMLHHLTHHKMNFVCKLCNHVSKLPSKAKEHYDWHKGVKYDCLYCDRTFVKRTSQFNHMRNRHGSACCDICQQVFSGERGLSTHIIKAHRDAKKSRCKVCGTQFLTEEAMSKHLDSLPDMVCQPDFKPCPQCGDNFTTEDELNSHSKQFHWKEIKCEKCNANFENEKLYRMHCIVHKELRAQRSLGASAGGGGGGRGGGKKQMRAAPPTATAGPRPLQKTMCEMCGLTWRSAAALRYHQRVHTGEKPHQCPVCHKSFRIQDSLQIHMNTHTGARPFKCPHCPKAFKSRTQNHKHQLVHTKIRRYRCDLCDKTFQTSTCVKTHIRSVHMKLPAPPRVRHRRAAAILPPQQPIYSNMPPHITQV